MSMRAAAYRFHNRSNNPQTVLKAIRENIRNRREQLGWTQNKLAREAKVSQRFISLLESSDEVPNIAMVCRIADALGTTVFTLQQAGAFGGSVKV